MSARYLWTSRAAAAALAALFLSACAWEATVAFSEYEAGRGTPAGSIRATKLVPWHGDAWRRLGLSRLDSDPAAATRDLLRATALNISDADSLIALGLLAESRGELASAERYLIAAAGTSKRFKPQWSLAFFYARRGRPDRFWPAAAIAAGIPAADATPVFELAHHWTDNPNEVTARLKLRSQHALLQYLSFLLTKGGAGGLAELSLRIDVTVDSQAMLLESCERLIASQRTREAILLWNRMSSELAPERGISLTDKHFQHTGGGFRWRALSNSGVELSSRRDGIRLEFSGNQAEAITLLEQIVPVLPGRFYHFTFAYRTSGMMGATGLSWRVSGAGPEAQSPPLAALEAGAGSLTFRAGPGDLIRIALRCERPSGSVRLAGAATMVSADLQLL
ncbi:MAG TPA: hypothetical protein VMZ52_02535 [Bryobacteraceae bacterium]|nr:hypothetical protein [Bryobacteraceae bacterium]